MLRRVRAGTAVGVWGSAVGERFAHGARWVARTLTAEDRRALGLWGGAHLALAVIAWMSTWMGGQRSIYNDLVGTYGQWDAGWFQGIAAHGYFSGHTLTPDAFAFWPGQAVAVALVHLPVRNWVVSELLVSLIAGSAAVVSVGRAGGTRAVLYLLAAPAAAYLMVGYSEALFLALALPAWTAAQRRDWPLAALLAACAGLVRIDGLYLIAGMLVMALTSEPGRRIRAMTWMSVGLLGPLLYEVYLWVGTGSWTAYMAANRAWGLWFTWPWTALRNTWQRAFAPGLAPDQAAMFQLEIACMAAGVVLTLVLLRRRAWPEATFVGLMFITLGTVAYYQSVPRALLVSWPLYLLVARAAERWPWIGALYLWACAPLAVITSVMFVLGRWAV